MLWSYMLSPLLLTQPGDTCGPDACCSFFLLNAPDTLLAKLVTVLTTGKLNCPPPPLRIAPLIVSPISALAAFLISKFLKFCPALSAKNPAFFQSPCPIASPISLALSNKPPGPVILLVPPPNGLNGLGCLSYLVVAKPFN